MQFKDVIGQHELKQHLTDMLLHNRLSHALLFIGKEGFGGLPLALAFAQYVVCENKQSAISRQSTVNRRPSTVNQPTTNNHQPTTDSCGACAACLKAKQFAHPDISLSVGVPPTDKENLWFNKRIEFD